MKHLTFSLIVLCAGLVTACDKSAVPYTEARNYFVRNDVSQVPEVITTEADFMKYFGMATTMGLDGKPTEIDWDKQFVIAAVLPETSVQTEIKPVKLKSEGDHLVFTYMVREGETMSYTSRPSLIVIVEGDGSTPVILVRK